MHPYSCGSLDTFRKLSEVIWAIRFKTMDFTYVADHATYCLLLVSQGEPLAKAPLSRRRIADGHLTE